MSETSPNVVIPGFMPGIQISTGSLRCGFTLTTSAGACGPLDPGDKPRDDTRRERPTVFNTATP
jgi:hypothetical protein